MRKSNKVALLVMITLLGLAVTAGLAAYIPPEQPVKTAEKFVRALGNGDYLTAYQLLTLHAQRQMTEFGIKKFADFDEQIYTQTEMDFLLQTNSGGHRSVIFDDLVLRYAKGFKLTKSSPLKDAKGQTIKRNGDEAVIRIYCNGRSQDLKMKKEFAKWKASWYPY